MAKIGFIGLGNMGLPMAKNLVGAGHSVTGFDLSADAVAGLVEAGGVAAADPAAAVDGAEIVVTALPAARHVKGVYCGQGGILDTAANGTIFIDCSTIDVASAREVITEAEERGQMMIDSPMSGGIGGATAGTLTFMVGGNGRGLCRCPACLDRDGQEHLSRRRPGRRLGGQDLQQHDAGDPDDLGGRRLQPGRTAGSGCAETLRYLVDGNRAVLVPERLLPRTRPGPDSAIEPRLSTWLFGRTDAEGSAHRDGGRSRRRRCDAAGCTRDSDLRDDGSGRPIGPRFFGRDRVSERRTVAKAQLAFIEPTKLVGSMPYGTDSFQAHGAKTPATDPSPVKTK